MRVGLALLACAASLWAQGGRRYAVPEEVGRILALQEDSQGFLWVGSEEGLFRFDGHRFQPVGQWAGLPRERVDVLAVAVIDSAVWIGMPSGLYRLRDAKAERLSDKPVTDLVWLGLGMMAAVPDVGLAYWYRENGRWVNRVQRATPAPLYLHPTLTDEGVTYAEGAVLHQVRWTGTDFATTRETIAGQTEALREAVLLQNHLLLASKKEHAVAEKRDGAWTIVSLNPVHDSGKLLRRTSPGEALINGLSLMYFRNGPQLAEQAISAPVFAPMQQGSVAAYLPGPGELLVYHWGGSATQFDEDFGVQQPRAVRWTAGRWLVPTAGGISALYLNDSRCRRPPYVVMFCPWVGTGTPFHDVLGDRAGRLWGVSREAGVVRLDEKRGIVATARLPKDERSDHLLGITEAPDGRIFVASKDALHWLDDSGGEPRLVPLPGFRYTAGFTKTHGGELWAVADTKLARYHDGNWVDVALPGCILSPNLRSLAVENDRSLWLAYRREVGFTNLRKDGAGNWTCDNYTERNGFPTMVSWLWINRYGRLWVAGRDRLYLTNLELGKRPRLIEDWEEVNARHGLTAGEIELYGVTENSDGGIWLATQQGITIFGPGFLRQARPPLVDAVERTGAVDWLSAGGWVNERNGRVRSISVADVPLAPGAPSRRPLWRYVRANGELSDYKPVVGGRISLENAPSDIVMIEFQRRDGAPLGMFALLPPRTPSWRYPATVASAVLSFLLLLLYWRYRGTWADRIGLWRDAISVRLRGRAVEHNAPLLLVPGQRLRNRYVVEGLLARGGFSEVHSAIDSMELNRQVAVKALSLENPLRPDYREWMHSRFIEELKALRTVDHPGVVKLLDAWWEDGTPCLAMPLIQGITLRELLHREGKLAPEVVASLVRELGSALRAAHRRGVLHGDIKPENILITGEEPGQWSPVIIDFGTSRLRQEASLRKQDKFVAGTRHYMAPEQALGILVEASDVWALALVTVEMLTGRHRAELAEGEDNGLPRQALDAAWVADPAGREANPEAWAEQVSQFLEARAGM